jgi:hypothetical protein
VLLREGDTNEGIYIIQEGSSISILLLRLVGQVGVYKRQGQREVEICKVLPGNFFGMCIVASIPTRHR